MIRFLRGNVATSGVLADHIESVTVNPSGSHPLHQMPAAMAPRSEARTPPMP
jgi:hypothetical protein